MIKERTVLVVIISAMLIIIASIVLPKPAKDKNISKRFWAYKTHNNIKYNVIIIGDSRVYRGISPKEMEKVLTGKKILNFGYSSGRLNSLFFNQAEKRLNKSSDKNIIVIGLTPNSLIHHPDENELLIEQLTLPKEEIIQRIQLKKVADLFLPVKPKDIFNSKKREKNYIEIFHDDGWVESYIINEDTTKALKKYEKWLTEVDVSQEMIDELINQTTKWVEQGIQVYAFRPPSTYSMEKMEESLAKFNQEKIVERFENAGGIWIQVNSKDYHSYDGSHLHKDSAIKLSRAIAEEIKKHLEE